MSAGEVVWRVCGAPDCVGVLSVAEGVGAGGAGPHQPGLNWAVVGLLRRLRQFRRGCRVALAPSCGPLSELVLVSGRLGFLRKIGGCGFLLVPGWFFGRFGGFGGSVPIIVLVLAEQLECSGGLGEDADGLGTAYLHWVGVALVGEDVGDFGRWSSRPGGAVPGLPWVCSLRPLAEPDVRLSPHPALHKVMPVGRWFAPAMPGRGSCSAPAAAADRDRGDVEQLNPVEKNRPPSPRVWKRRRKAAPLIR